MKKNIAAFIIVAILLCIMPHLTYSCFVDSRLHDDIPIPAGLIDSLETVRLKGVLTADSLNYYVDCIEDMYMGIWDLKKQYSSDVNVMINKTDAWISYWMGVFALVLTVPAIILAIQYYQSNKHWSAEFSRLQHDVLVQKRFDRILQSRLVRRVQELETRATMFIENTKSDFDTWKTEKDKEIERQSSALDKKTEKRIKDLSEEQSEKLKADVCYLEKSVRENRISSIMMCLSSFPDPQMVAERSEIRNIIVSYLNQLYKEYRDYVMTIREQLLLHNCDFIGTCLYARLVLLCIKLAVIRTQNSFSELNQDVSFHNLLRSIDQVFSDMELGKITESNLTESLMGVSEKLLVVLRITQGLRYL